MHQFLNQVTFVHWPYSPGVMRPFVPARLDLDTFEGTAWVGLVPFLLEDLRFPELPSVPWLSRFPQTNLRTYVCGPDGKQGIWFFSLETARLLAVPSGRLRSLCGDWRSLP